VELRKPLIFGLFRVVPVFSGINGRDGDGGDEGLVAVEIGVAFWQDVDGGEVIFAELVGQQAEPPAENHHVGGGEGEREFLRRCLRTATIVVAGVRVGFQRVINQLAGVEAVAVILVEMELDTGAKLAGAGVTGIIFELWHRR